MPCPALVLRGNIQWRSPAQPWGSPALKNALNYIALHCISLHCISLHCIALHCIALHCIALHCIALHCIALHCIALHCIALHCIALHCIALHCIALHCIALHCIALHCIALHYIALHYITPNITLHYVHFPTLPITPTVTNALPCNKSSKPCPALPCPNLPCPALQQFCPAKPCPVCPELPCPDWTEENSMPCGALPWTALKLPALPWTLVSTLEVHIGKACWRIVSLSCTTRKGNSISYRMSSCPIRHRAAMQLAIELELCGRCL